MPAGDEKEESAIVFEGASAANQGFLWRRTVDARQEAADAAATAQALAKTVRDLRAQLEAMRLRAAEESCYREGIAAQAKALKAAYPTSPLFQDSGRRSAKGVVKSRIGLIFDAAFDACAQEWGLQNPERIRDK